VRSHDGAENDNRPAILPDLANEVVHIISVQK